jgi:hypothetical protein
MKSTHLDHLPNMVAKFEKKKGSQTWNEKNLQNKKTPTYNWIKC